MTTVQTAPYGSWQSPLTAGQIAASTIGLAEIQLDGADIYWSEMRPSEGGRYVIMRFDAEGQIREMNPAPFNARTRVHEYGGGAFTVSNSEVYFSNYSDQRLYFQSAEASPPEPVTAEGAWRYADGVADPKRGCFFCVREDHSHDDAEAVNAIVRIQLAGGETEVLASGNDFYSSPCLSPNGNQLAWLTWNHPNMPWDGCELWLADIRPDGSLAEPEQIAGGLTESIFQPQFSPDGTLYFISDRSGWWNLYRWQAGQIEALTQLEAEFGKPQWVFGQSTYGFQDSDRIICTFQQHGNRHLARLNLQKKTLEAIKTPYTAIGYLYVTPTFAVFIGGSPSQASSLVKLNLETGEQTVLRQSSKLTVDPDFLSVPQSIEFPTEDNLTAFAYYYPPKNPNYAAPPDERPPLLVNTHGGPTGSTSNTFNPLVQFWTSRGFAVVDVNYGGSTGYGRAYRERLKGRWGIVDIDDCCNAAAYLVERDEADGDRLAIRGGSAGGYTTLAALAFRDIFKAGANYFGVSDLAGLALETHKFESRYLDGLIGPYPERKDLYDARSPIHHADQITRPLIVFQGLEDRVVLPNQSEMIVDALCQNGIPVAYLPFEGEQHGFRRAENIKRTLEAELYFYSRIFAFSLAEEIEPITIKNLELSNA